MQLSEMSEWPKLKALAETYKAKFDLRKSMEKDGLDRVFALCINAPYLRVDMSKQIWGPDVMQSLLSAAKQMGLLARIKQLFAGEVVNPTENRPALHALWRRNAVGPMESIPASLKEMLALAEQIRARPDIEDIVHIGVGGSSLGPEMALQALKAFQTSRQRVHVVSNLDGHDLQQALHGLTPSRTMLIVVSKSWSTPETLRNAESAICWMRSRDVQDIAPHVVAVTSKPSAARTMGISNVLDMPDGIGGRFSLWSAVGLPVAIAIGAARFMEMLKGGAEMDEHFFQTDYFRNLPVLMGILDVWNNTFLGNFGRCVVPYHHGLRRLPAYLQQLEMESNGKRVDLCGRQLTYNTAGITWGDVGSNSQHAFFQWLHQGTQYVPLELILVKKPDHKLQGHHIALLSNGLAQAQSLMLGQSAESNQIVGHQDFPGNRPSTIIGMESLTPASLGALLSLYEHRAFVAGVTWGINPFDQYGVELGKSMAQKIADRLRNGVTSGLDDSTDSWINWLHQ